MSTGSKSSRYWRHKAELVCHECGDDLKTGEKGVCLPCKLKVAARVDKSRVRSGVLKGTQRCSVCDKLGHNARRHQRYQLLMHEHKKGGAAM